MCTRAATPISSPTYRHFIVSTGISFAGMDLNAFVGKMSPNPPVGSALGHDLELLPLPASHKLNHSSKRPDPALPSNVP